MPQTFAMEERNKALRDRIYDSVDIHLRRHYEYNKLTTSTDGFEVRVCDISNELLQKFLKAVGHPDNKVQITSHFHATESTIAVIFDQFHVPEIRDILLPHNPELSLEVMLRFAIQLKYPYFAYKGAIYETGSGEIYCPDYSLNTIAEKAKKPEQE